MRQFIVSAAVLGVALAACGGGPTAATGPSQRAVEANREKNVQAAIASLNTSHKIKFSPTAAVYVTDSIAVHDGSEVALFTASAQVRHDASRLTVVDPDSGQTFHFSPQATVQTIVGGGRVYVERGEAVPGWARASNARPAAL